MSNVLEIIIQIITDFLVLDEDLPPTFFGVFPAQNEVSLGTRSPKRVQLRQDQAKTGRVAPLVRRDPLPVYLDREQTAPMGPKPPAHERNGCMRL